MENKKENVVGKDIKKKTIDDYIKLNNKLIKEKKDLEDELKEKDDRIAILEELLEVQSELCSIVMNENIEFRTGKNKSEVSENKERDYVYDADTDEDENDLYDDIFEDEEELSDEEYKKFLQWLHS